MKALTWLKSKKADKKQPQPETAGWFCAACGTPCQGDCCPKCGMTRAQAFGLEEFPPEKDIPEVPVTERIPDLPAAEAIPATEAIPDAFPTASVVPPVLFEEPAQGRWFCTECGTPCEGDACPNCGMTRAKAFGLEEVAPVEEAPAEELPVTLPEPIPEPIPEPQEEAFPETVRIVPPVLFEEPARNRWFCTECGTPCEGDACPNCGMTRARAFGLEPVEETPEEAAPVEEAPAEELPVTLPEPIPEPVPEAKEEAFPETVRIAPPVLFEEPAQSRWFCTECGTPCEGDACPNCGMTRAKAFGLEEPAEEMPEPPVEVLPEIPEAPQAEAADLEQPHWFCIACGTFCQGECCPGCGTTRAQAFGLDQTEEKPLEPVFEVPVPEEAAEEIPLFTLDTQPEPEPEPEPVPVQPVPRYVKLAEQWDQNGWTVYDYLFVTYDEDFSLSCAQAIMDEAGRVDNATRTPVPGAPEEDVTQLLIGCGRNIRQCPAFAGGSAGLGIGVMTQGMTVKTFLNPGTNRITVMAAGASGEETVSRYLNSIIHQALRN